MAIEGNLDYALTRVQAAHGALPQEADWQSLESSLDIAHYLERARLGPLSAWVTGFDARTDLHVIERALRTQWGHEVAHEASWHPREWQPWLRWLMWLPSLPLLAPLARESAPEWLQSDPALSAVAQAAVADRAAALEKTPLEPLSPLTDVAGRWRQRWGQLLPRTDDGTRAHLRQLLATLGRHTARLGHADTLRLRAERVARLNILFRQSCGTPVATASHLGRLALEVARLRGGLASRMLLGAP